MHEDVLREVLPPRPGAAHATQAVAAHATKADAAKAVAAHATQADAAKTVAAHAFPAEAVSVAAQALPAHALPSETEATVSPWPQEGSGERHRELMMGT
jgi:guanyl-specific ribonuclease Sa